MPINEEKIVEKIIQLENKIDDFRDEIRNDLKRSEDRIISVVDSAMKKMSDVDIEQLSIRATLDRHQDEIDANKKDILKIKKVVKIA